MEGARRTALPEQYLDPRIDKTDRHFPFKYYAGAYSYVINVMYIIGQVFLFIRQLCVLLLLFISYCAT
jgi:hypothetical protein